MMYRRGWIALLLFTLALINYIDRVTLSFAATPIAKEYGLSPVLLGYLFSSFLWTYTLFLLPMGLLVDRFGAKRVAGFGLAIWSVSTAATGLAGSFPALLTSRLVMGAGEASSNPAGARVIREWIPAGERGLVNAIFNSGSYAGPAICALAAGPIIALYGWRALFFIAGSIGVLWLVCWLIWFDRPERASWLGETERAKILAERSIATTATGDTAPKPGLRQLLGSGTTLWGLALTQGCNVYSQYLFLTWLPSYLQQSKGLTLAKTGLFAAIPYAVAVVLCIAIGRLSDRFLRGDVGGGKRRFVIAGAMILASTHPSRADGRQRRAHPGADLAVADRHRRHHLDELRAAERFVAGPPKCRSGHGVPRRRGQFVRADGADRDRLRHRSHRQLRHGVRHRGCPAADRRDIGVDADPSADRRDARSRPRMTDPAPTPVRAVARRAVLGGFAMVAGSSLFAAAAPAPLARFAYVGCRTTKERNARGLGIEVFRVEPTGAWSHVQRVTGLDNPSFLTLDREQLFLYAVHGDLSDISAYRVDPATGC